MTEHKQPEKTDSKNIKHSTDETRTEENNGDGEHLTTLDHLTTKLNDMAQQLERVQIADYVSLINSPRKIIKSNLLAGLSRGVGFTIGVSVFTAVIVYFLQLLGALNLPIVGDFITEIVKYVQFQLDGGTRHF